MYDLNTRGRLEVRSFDDESLVRVVAEDVSVAEAFPLVTALREEDLAAHDGDWSWVFWLVPPGVEPLSGDVLSWQDGSSDIVLMGGDFAEVDHFVYGDELGFGSDEGMTHGFARAVWADGVDRWWWPAD